MSASIIRRVVCQKIRPQLFSSPRKFCNSGSELVGRPSLMMPPSFVDEGRFNYNFVSPLKEDTVSLINSGGKEEFDLMQDECSYWTGSSHGWLILYNTRRNCNIYLINPISGRSIQLPSIGNDTIPFKVILSQSPAEKEGECRALAIHGASDRAAVYSPGRCEKGWSPLGQLNDPPRRYRDFVYYASEKSFLSANHVASGTVITDYLEFWDPSSTMEAPVKTVRTPPYSPLSDPGFIWWTYLATEEESGQVFMVRRYKVYDDDTRPVVYKVYRIHKTAYVGDDVVQVCESLDDMVMFIGMNHCFAAKASKYPEYDPNCIYFGGGWSNQSQLIDSYDYHTQAYSQFYTLAPGQDFPFHSPLPWFTLTNN